MARDRKSAISSLKEESGAAKDAMKEILIKIQILAKYMIFNGDKERDLPPLIEEVKKIRDEVLEK